MQKFPADLFLNVQNSFAGEHKLVLVKGSDQDKTPMKETKSWYQSIVPGPHSGAWTQPENTTWARPPVVPHPAGESVRLVHCELDSSHE